MQYFLKYLYKSKLFKNLLTIYTFLFLFLPLSIIKWWIYFAWTKSMRKIFIVAATWGFVFRTMCKTAFCFEIYLSFSLSCSRFWPSVSEVATWNLHFSWGTFAKRIQDQLYICARHRFHGTVININTCQRIFTLETHVGKERRKIVFEKWIYIYIKLFLSIFFFFDDASLLRFHQL